VHGVWGSALWRPRARKSRDNAFDAKDARGGVPRARRASSRWPQRRGTAESRKWRLWRGM